MPTFTNPVTDGAKIQKIAQERFYSDDGYYLTNKSDGSGPLSVHCTFQIISVHPKGKGFRGKY